MLQREAVINRVSLPGDIVRAEEGESIRIGPGLLQARDKAIVSKAGVLRSREAGAFAVQTRERRYTPRVGDQVVGIVVERFAEFYRVDIGCAQSATLSVLAYEGATRRSRLELPLYAVVYCRVTLADRDLEPEVVCMSAAGSSLGFGELKGGMLINVNLATAQHLVSPACSVLRALGRHFPFEVAVGGNGRVWVNSGSPKHTVLAMNSIHQSERLPGDKIELFVEQAVKTVMGSDD